MPSMARVYADVNSNLPRSYWDYDSVNISQSIFAPVPSLATMLYAPVELCSNVVTVGWGVLENYEVVRKIGMLVAPLPLRSSPPALRQ
jgi:casein kinase II subunit alpha